MKTLVRNIILGSFIATGMVVISSSVYADNRNTSSNKKEATTTTVSTGGRRTVSEPTKSKGNINRPVTQNSGNASANNWPSENKPNINSNRNSGSVSTSRPADLRKGENARPDVMDDKKNNRYDNDKRGDKHNGYDNGYGYGNNHNGAYNGYNSGWKAPLAPPVRTNRPADYRIITPSRPSGYRPTLGCPDITGIFGISFGMSYYESLNYLYRRGYDIDGYYDNKVYLRNVSELGFVWPDAIIRYNNRGFMKSAELHSSTNYNSTSRYTRIYNDLCRIYGMPIKYKAKKGEYKTVWYGGNGRGYVTLEYYRTHGRYYTTLAYSY